MITEVDAIGGDVVIWPAEVDENGGDLVIWPLKMM